MELQKQVEAYIDAHREEIIEDWKTLVNLEGKGNQPEAMEEVARFLRGLFTAAGFTCTLEWPEEAPPVLIGTLGPERPRKPVLFGGHYDTVNQLQYGNRPRQQRALYWTQGGHACLL